MEKENQIPEPIRKKFEELFEGAHDHTIELMRNIIAYEKNMTNLVTNELNDKMKEAVHSANEEIEFATFAGIPLERMSSLAQNLYADPSLAPRKEFKVISTESTTKTRDIFVDDNTKFTVKEVEIEDGVAEIFMPEEAPATATPRVEGEEIFVTTSATDKTPIEDTIVATKHPEDTVVATAPILVPVEKKPHSQKRREWLALTSMIIEDECELKIEVARLTERDQKRIREREKTAHQEDKISEFCR